MESEKLRMAYWEAAQCIDRHAWLFGRSEGITEKLRQEIAPVLKEYPEKYHEQLALEALQSCPDEPTYSAKRRKNYLKTLEKYSKKINALLESYNGLENEVFGLVQFDFYETDSLLDFLADKEVVSCAKELPEGKRDRTIRTLLVYLAKTPGNRDNGYHTTYEKNVKVKKALDVMRAAPPEYKSRSLKDFLEKNEHLYRPWGDE